MLRIFMSNTLIEPQVSCKPCRRVVRGKGDKKVLLFFFLQKGRRTIWRLCSRHHDSL